MGGTPEEAFTGTRCPSDWLPPSGGASLGEKTAPSASLRGKRRHGSGWLGGEPLGQALREGFLEEWLASGWQGGSRGLRPPDLIPGLSWLFVGASTW